MTDSMPQQLSLFDPEPYRGEERRQWWQMYEQQYLRTTHWREVRACVIALRGRRCERCGRACTRVEVHHRRYRLFREQLADLIVLCPACHAGHHEREWRRLCRQHRPAVTSGASAGPAPSL
jgi:hypothetical protein